MSCLPAQAPRLRGVFTGQLTIIRIRLYSDSSGSTIRMYVCICNALRESQIRELAIERPSATAEEIYATLGVDPDCGTCLYYAQDVIDAERAKLSTTVELASL